MGPHRTVGSPIAITANPQTNAAAWLEPVSDEEYRKATTEAESRYAEANEVLTVHEQAIVAVASYTGKGDLEHLKPALTQALETGMTINRNKRSVDSRLRLLRGFRAACGRFRLYAGSGRTESGRNKRPGRSGSIRSQGRQKSLRAGTRRACRNIGYAGRCPESRICHIRPYYRAFSKEHLFTDLFERDLLTCRERELATVSILAGVSGVEPMAVGHMSICLHLGITPEQLSALLNIVEMNLGKNYSEPLRKVLNQITEKK